MVFRIKGKFYSYLTNLRPLYCTQGIKSTFENQVSVMQKANSREHTCLIYFLKERQ